MYTRGRFHSAATTELFMLQEHNPYYLFFSFLFLSFFFFLHTLTSEILHQLQLQPPPNWASSLFLGEPSWQSKVSALSGHPTLYVTGRDIGDGSVSHKCFVTPSLWSSWEKSKADGILGEVTIKWPPSHSWNAMQQMIKNGWWISSTHTAFTNVWPSFCLLGNSVVPKHFTLKTRCMGWFHLAFLWGGFDAP